MHGDFPAAQYCLHVGRKWDGHSGGSAGRHTGMFDAPGPPVWLWAVEGQRVRGPEK